MIGAQHENVDEGYWVLERVREFLRAMGFRSPLEKMGPRRASMKRDPDA